MEKVRFCKSCNNVLVGNETVCSKCGRKYKKIYKQWWLYVMVLISVGIAAIIAVPKTSISAIFDKSDTNAVQQVFNKNKFELIGEITTANDGYCYYINGVLKNNSSKMYNFVQVSFNLYDKDGNQIGTAFANANNFEPGGTWKFRAQGYVPNVSEIKSYKLVAVDVY